MTIWNKIHSIDRGYGLMEYIPNNDIVIEDHSDEFPKWKIIKCREQARIIWSYDCYRLLGINCFDSPINLDELYIKLQQLLQSEAQTNTKYFGGFRRIVMPIIGSITNWTDIKQILSENSLKDAAQ